MQREAPAPLSNPCSPSTLFCVPSKLCPLPFRNPCEEGKHPNTAASPPLAESPSNENGFSFSAQPASVLDSRSAQHKERPTLRQTQLREATPPRWCSLRKHHDAPPAAHLERGAAPHLGVTIGRICWTRGQARPGEEPVQRRADGQIQRELR